MQSQMESVRRKIDILKSSFPFFRDFLESNQPNAQEFNSDLGLFSEGLLKIITSAELELLKKLSKPISMLPKNARYDKIVIALSHEGVSFYAKDRVFHIEPLSDATLKNALDLVKRCFPKEFVSLEHPKIALRASLTMQKSGVKGWVIKLLSRKLAGVIEVKYWVVIEARSQKVVGISGLYSQKEDKDLAVWGGWTCVHPYYRPYYGIALKLGNFILAKAGATGKRYLRLRSSTHPNEAAANKIYLRKGFRLIKREPIKGTELEWLYWEKQLN